ncbi:MAG: glycosyltransferase [Thermoleophilaceae bacterium]
MEVNLESPLPASLPVGKATAIFCFGSCTHDVERIQLVVDGVRHPVAAFGMPRPDLGNELTGFWGTVPVTPHEAPGAVELEAAIGLPDGRETLAPLGRVAVVEPSPPPPFEVPSPDMIAICMATFEPDMDLFRAQVESLRAQTYEHWICLVSDDCSAPEQFEQITDVIGSDTRFVVSRSEVRRGFYRNFERALEMVPAGVRLVALCDHDDRWYPEKLQVLHYSLGSAQLVYSDQRLLDIDGRVLRDTLWSGRRNNHTDLASLLVANSITGAASLFRREVMQAALPFPDPPGIDFHDHWIGLVALASGDVAYVDRPLYDYVQHRGAVFGEVTQGPKPSLRSRLRGWRAAYFCGYMQREVQAQALLARLGDRLTGKKRRVLERYVAAQRSLPAFAWLAARSLRRFAGRSETLGSESELAQGILWKWMIELRSRLPGRRLSDASFPDPMSFQQRRLRRWRARV